MATPTMNMNDGWMRSQKVQPVQARCSNWSASRPHVGSKSSRCMPSPPEAIASYVAIGAWPLMMGVTMYLQQKLNPQPVDPVQARMFMMLPVVFTYMLSAFPAGLVIYWAWNNLLSICQQYAIMHRAGAA